MPVARSLADTLPCSASRCAWLSASACARARARAGVSPSACAQTEANKIIMQYLCWRASHSAGKLGKKMRFSEEALAAAGQLATGGTEGLDDLPRKILHSNVVFEAFGNASTTNKNRLCDESGVLHLPFP